MTANPVHVGRILEHAPDWRWLRLDRRADALHAGDRIRVRPVIEDAPDYPFRTGECRVLSTMDDVVHVERAAWADIAAIADMDHVYLTERPEHRIGCGDQLGYGRPAETGPSKDFASYKPLQKTPATPGKQWVTPLGPGPDDVRAAGGYEYSLPPARPDGFDQGVVDAAKAAMLAPAPPRYPRTR